MEVIRPEQIRNGNRVGTMVWNHKSRPFLAPSMESFGKARRRKKQRTESKGRSGKWEAAEGFMEFFMGSRRSF